MAIPHYPEVKRWPIVTDLWIGFAVAGILVVVRHVIEKTSYPVFLSLIDEKY